MQTTIVAGVYVELDNGFVLNYRFKNQQNRNRFSSLLRFYKLTDSQVNDILEKYDAYWNDRRKNG